ncbi:mitochondrial fission ELM1 family protein [Luteimonas aestuarii]|uniref:mitochondrial fission ELM1 family protein n=1 Tax=Luteimonas aestuarii TaxID=453837 RepID=UPI001FB6D666|nr:mitochondrial fission ELM1 family protein [Luteimonas aestuarii]
MERSPSHPALSAPIWAVSDGRAGNARQAEALAVALAGGDAIESIVLSPRAPWKWMAPRALPGSHAAFGAEFATRLASPPALVVGCGRQAALATRLLRARGSRVVQVLDPRIDPRHWDLVVVPEHDTLRGDNVVVTRGGLHPVDDAWLARARTAFDAFSSLPGPRTALLLGGGSRHVPFDVAEFDRLADQLDAVLARDGGSVLATTSRRSSDALRDRLKQRYGHAPHVTWRGADDGDNPYPGLLAWADRIVCSPDSVNMVSEACATRAPVFVFEPDRVQGAPRRFLDALLSSGRIRVMDDALASFDAEPLRESARVAAEIKQRLTLPL